MNCRKFGEEEKKKVLEVIDSQHCFSAHGSRVKRLQERLANQYDVAKVATASSGTAALHVGLGAVGVDIGDEVITSPITDTGTVIAIMLLGAVPVFADVDERNFNISPESIESKITDKTKAIMPVHYAGYACDMDKIMKLANDYGLKVVEDCCQALGAKYKSKGVGTIGDAGCYSTNDTKPISCGDGGFVLCKDEKIGERAQLFSDKGFDRANNRRNPLFLAPGYRLTELQAAILDAQFDSFPERLEVRKKYGKQLDALASKHKWLGVQHGIEGSDSVYFNWSIILKDDCLDVENICNKLSTMNVKCAPHSLYDAMYNLDIFTHALPKYYAYFNKDYKSFYQSEKCLVADKILKQHLRILISEFDSHEYIKNAGESLVSTVSESVDEKPM